MVKKITIFGWELTFVFRHRWEKDMDLTDKMDWATWGLGVWYRRYKTISKPKHNAAILGQRAKLVTLHMLGMNLLVCKFWFTICFRPLTLKYEKNK